MELFVFTDNMVFESVFYKGTSKIPLLFELVIRLHQVHTRRYLIHHVVHIVGKIIIESGIYGLARRNNLVGMIRGLNPLQFVLLDKGTRERSTMV